jgi:ankyrin repeat protein
MYHIIRIVNNIRNREDIVQILLKYGADVNARDSMGERSLHWAVKENQYVMIFYNIL